MAPCFSGPSGAQLARGQRGWSTESGEPGCGDFAECWRWSSALPTGVHPPAWGSGAGFAPRRTVPRRASDLPWCQTLRGMVGWSAEGGAMSGFDPRRAAPTPAQLVRLLRGAARAGTLAEFRTHAERGPGAPAQVWVCSKARRSAGVLGAERAVGGSKLGARALAATASGRLRRRGHFERFARVVSGRAPPQPCAADEAARTRKPGSSTNADGRSLLIACRAGNVAASTVPRRRAGPIEA